MVENSTAGLVMVGGDAAITVTREEQHQHALARYAPTPGGERLVAVELTWCEIGSGKHKGQRAIEVRLDGRRVGELTHLMSRRYAPLVARVNAHNGRAGCEAVIVREARGLQLTLRLPRDPDAVPVPPARPVVTDAPTVVLPHVRHVPAPAAPESTFTKHRTVWLVGAAAVVVLLFAAIVGNDDDPSAGPAGQTSIDTTIETTTTDEPPPPTTSSTTTTPPPPPTTTTAVLPPPAPVTQAPVPPPVTQQPPAQSRCDPNYSGCVPIASDVDCAGGSGNGPAYAEGPIDVIGSDIYDLDRDGDGVACE